MAEVTSTPEGMTVIVLSAKEADSLDDLLYEHVIKGEWFAGHGGPIRRAYPDLAELAEAMA
jgi:hypothetical protein